MTSRKNPRNRPHNRDRQLSRKKVKIPRRDNHRERPWGQDEGREDK